MVVSRELVKAAIQHKETAKVPYAIYFTKDGIETLERNINPMTAYQYTDNDVIRVLSPWWDWFDPDLVWQALDCPGGVPYIKGYGDYANFFNSLKQLRDNTDKYILVAIYAAHWEKAHNLRGFENFIFDIGMHTSTAKRILNRIIDINMAMLETYIASPEIDGVLLGSDWGSQVDLLISPECWLDLIRPGEQKMYDLIHAYGKDLWVHSCGNILKIIPALIEMGVDVLNPVQPEAMDIYMLKERFGDMITFWGGLSTQQLLPFGTPQEIEQEARKVLDKMSEGGGYIFSPAQEIQGDVPAENIKKLIDVAKKYPES